MINILNMVLLLSIEGIGRRNIYQILNQYGIEELRHKDLKEVIKSRIPALSFIEINNFYEKSKRVLEWAEKSNINIIDYMDARFPQSLKTIPDPPILLFIKGDYTFINNEKNCIAVIGSREATDYGKEISKMVGSYLAQKGIGVISGLALGCDTGAHIGCLQGEGRTAAILAHGLDMIYPYENKRLAEKIVSSGGCIISEYLPYKKPKNYTFIERDRIQSGLSKGVIVIETEERGGTIHTVGFAQKQNKKIGCMKYPSLFKEFPNLKGNEMILKRGNAIPIKNYRDIDRFISI